MIVPRPALERRVAASLDASRIPVVLVDIARYYAGLLAWDRHAARAGFLYGGRLFHVASSPARAVRILRSLL